MVAPALLRDALWPTVAAAACLIITLTSVANPAAGPLGFSLVVLAVGGAAALAAIRSRGLDRLGWALIALSSPVAGIGGIVFQHDYTGVAMATVGIISTILLANGLLCFIARTAGELLAVVLQSQVLACVAVIALWVLGESPEVRWTLDAHHDSVLQAVIQVVVTVLAFGIACLAVFARRGRGRWIFVAIAAGLAFSALSDVILWIHRDQQDASYIAIVARAPELVLVVAASIAAAVYPPDIARRPLLDRTRDLTVLSILTLGVVLALVAPRPFGLDVSLGRTMVGLIVLLVATHLYEAYRARALTTSIEEQGRHMRLLVAESRDIIIELDGAGNVVFASEAMRNILGLRFHEFAGRHVSMVIPELTSETLGHVVHEPKARVQPTMRVESVLTTTTGSPVHAESVVTPLVRGFLVAVRDVTERVGLQSRLQQVTYQDIATGLPNRSSLEREIRNRLYSAADGDIALLLVDLFPSGPTSQNYDDEPGEDLPRLVGTFLPSLVRVGDVAARLSGHRYAVLLQAGTSTAHAVDEAERITRELNTPGHLGDAEPAASAGVCIGGRSGAEILRNAELALYQAAQSGPGAVRLFEPGMLAQYARTRDLRRLLAREPSTDSWTVLYQPVVDLQSGRTTGVEALLRWTHPEGDFIGIEEVIRLAEEFGSIIHIGAWVLDHSCAQAAQWAQSGRPLRVAVNVSVHQLTHPGFADVVEKALERHSLDPDLLTLEITETVVLEQTAETIGTLSELRALGVRIAIDDFGTGYSGLANIRTLPLDILKIDRTFIQGLGAGGSDEAVVNAVTSLGLELGLAITAEGIETPEQERLARQLGITAAQGYLYARPLPAAEITALVVREDTKADLTS